MPESTEVQEAEKRKLPPEIEEKVKEATGWVPWRVYPQKDNEIEMVMNDGCTLYVILTKEGKFDKIVQRLNPILG